MFENIYLVTGCAGFIGSHVTEALLEEGNTVIGIDNFFNNYSPSIKRNNLTKSLQSEKFRLYEIDILDLNGLEKIFSTYKFKTVIHLAALAGVRPSIIQPLLYNEVNVSGSINILELMKKYEVKNLIFASSSSVYGNNKKVPFSESDNVDKAISPYAATKKAMEVIAHTYHHLYNINMSLLRFFTVYGERQRPDLAIHKFTNLIIKGDAIPMYGDGTTRRDYTYISDIVGGLFKALSYTEKHENVYEIFNLGESKTISLSEMINTIEDALGIKAKVERLPMQSGDVMQTYADISKAKKILGYNPTTNFEDGIAKFVDWFKRNN